jgi:hypothetical protein
MQVKRTDLHVYKPWGWSTIRHTESIFELSGQHAWLHFSKLNLPSPLEVRNIALYYQNHTLTVFTLHSAHMKEHKYLKLFAFIV